MNTDQADRLKAQATVKERVPNRREVKGRSEAVQLESREFSISASGGVINCKADGERVYTVGFSIERHFIQRHGLDINRAHERGEEIRAEIKERLKRIRITQGELKQLQEECKKDGYVKPYFLSMREKLKNLDKPTTWIDEATEIMILPSSQRMRDFIKLWVYHFGQYLIANNNHEQLDTPSQEALSFLSELDGWVRDKHKLRFKPAKGIMIINQEAWDEEYGEGESH